MSSFPYDGKNSTGIAATMERTTNFSILFSICSYL